MSHKTKELAEVLQPHIDDGEDVQFLVVSDKAVARHSKGHTHCTDDRKISRPHVEALQHHTDDHNAV